MLAFPKVSPLGIGNAVRSPAFEFLQARIYSAICAAPVVPAEGQRRHGRGATFSVDDDNAR
jgi:hypothetical protein